MRTAPVVDRIRQSSPILEPIHRDIVVVGKESVGKTQLIATLAGKSAASSNYAGSTISVDTYQRGNLNFIDTPGILRKSDTSTTQLALASLSQATLVMLVLQATQLDDDLSDLLPLVHRMQGLIVVTFWDKVEVTQSAKDAIERLRKDLGVSILCVDGRNLQSKQATAIEESIETCVTLDQRFARSAATVRVNWRIEPKLGLLEHPYAGPLLAMGLILLPALATIFGANRLAEWLHPHVDACFQPCIAWVNLHLPAWLRWGLTAEQGGFGYGLLNMGPFLFVWALPTVVLFAFIMGIYKSTGLIERINYALDPLVRPIGLSGRDIVRVMMGFGCNVPAVISTRACSSCSRNSAIAAISFGAACSYQLPATLAVLSAAAVTHGGSSILLSLAFLTYLCVTTLVYVRLTSPKAARSPLNVLLTNRRPFMQWPTWRGLWREVQSTLVQFFRQALPIFLLICLGASLLAKVGLLDWLSHLLEPAMRVFNLPANAALPIIMASVRKDGIFLFASDAGLASPMTISQVLTGVYLAGVLLPCLVTALTIARETSYLNAARLLCTQAFFAIGFSLLLAWGGASLW